MIRVVIAEDQALVLAALAALVQIERDITVVGRATNGVQALDLVVSATPDVLLADIEMPQMTGLEVAAEIARRKLGTRTILLTTFARAGYLRRALDANVSGYLLKDSPGDLLANAVRRVNSGLRVIDPTLAHEAWTEPDPLKVIASAEYSGSRAKACRRRRSRRSWDYRRGPFATTCPTRSPNWVEQRIGSMPRASRG